MALVDVTRSCLDSIRQISEHIEGAVLYLDAGCIESFQLVGAFPTLLDLGVRAVCDLENMCSLDTVADWNANFGSARKIVVMTSRVLSDVHRYVLRCLSMHPGVFRCTILTSISEVSHSTYPDSPLGPDAFHEYETLLLQDYDELMKRLATESGPLECSNVQESNEESEGWADLVSSEDLSSHFDDKSARKDPQEDHAEDVGQKLVVSVHHFPMILCPLSARVFFLPSEGSIAEARLSTEHEDSITLGFPPLSTGSSLDGDEVPPGATLTANFLYHFAMKMDLKLEIFSIGDLSKSVGKILTDMSSLYDVGRRKRSAGLLLVDRTLDLLTPLSHGDSLVDRMFSSLPRRRRTSLFSISKGSQTQPDLSSIQRQPHTIEIPLGELLAEDADQDSFQLSKRVESFLCGWNSYKAASEEMVSLTSKVNDGKSFASINKLLNGSIASTENFRGTRYLEAILERSTKDGAILVKKWLQEALRHENIATNVRLRPGIATKSELLSMLKALAKSESSLLRNRGLIQLAGAAIIALDETHNASWDAFMSAEKILGISAGETSQSLAAQITDLINKSIVGSHARNGIAEILKGILSFLDALLLTLRGYILAGENFPTSGSGGPFSWQEEHFLKEAIVDAILENPSIAKLKFLHGMAAELQSNFDRKITSESKKTSLEELKIDDFDDDQWGEWGAEDEVNSEKDQAYDDVQLKLELRDKVDNLFKFLHKLSSLKRKNVPVREGPLASENSFSSDQSCKGLLYKLLTRILGKFDLPGLEYHSSTVGRLFKSGFGRFGIGQAKPSIADQNVILVFVVGGINCVEVREAQEALAESGRPDTELILGGTSLLTPDVMLDSLLGERSMIY